MNTRLHHRRNGAGAFGGQPILQDETDQQAADRRGQQYNPPVLSPGGGGDVLAHIVKPRHLHEADCQAEEDGGNASGQSDQRRQQPDDRLPALVECREVGDRPAPGDRQRIELPVSHSPIVPTLRADAHRALKHPATRAPDCSDWRGSK